MIEFIIGALVGYALHYFQPALVQWIATRTKKTP